MALPGGSVRLAYTYRDYCYLPDDGRRYEIVDGELYVNPAPAPFHQTVSRRLQYALMRQLEEPGLAWVFNAPIDVILDETTVVQPDLAVVRLSRKDLVTSRAIEGPPDVVIEILSPSTRGNDTFLKKTSYAKYGVAEYWIVDPEHGFVEVFGLGEGGYTLRARFDRAATLISEVLAEVAIPLAPVFKPH